MGTHSADTAPVTDRCGSTCTRLESARPGVGLAPYPGHPGGGLRVVAATDDVAAARGVGSDDERAVPQLAVEVLAVIALDALPRPEPLVDGAPGGQEGGQGPHVLGGGGGGAAPAEAHREPRETRLVHQPPARISRMWAAIASSASSQLTGTNPGASPRPLRGLVRFMGWRMRCGL